MSDLDHYNSNVNYSSIANSVDGVNTILKVFAPIQYPLLDIGCGTGRFLSMLPEPDVMGIDYSPARIAEAQARYPEIEFVCEDLGVFLVGNTMRYATISMFEVLEHLLAPPSILKAVARHCDRVIATVPLNNSAKTHTVIYRSVKAVRQAFPNIKVLHVTKKNVFFEYKAQ